MKIGKILSAKVMALITGPLDRQAILVFNICFFVIASGAI